MSDDIGAPTSPIDGREDGRPTLPKLVTRASRRASMGPASAVDGQPQSSLGRLRQGSISVLDSNPPLGMWAATGMAFAHAPNLTQLQDPKLSRNISFNANGQGVRTVEVPTLDKEEEIGLGRVATVTPLSPIAGIVETALAGDREAIKEGIDSKNGNMSTVNVREKHTWGQVIAQGLKAFWKFACTPVGFLMVIYALNIVGWGAMLFFLELKAAPAMNYVPPGGNPDNAPRLIWLEIASQILNALFCVTGFGLAPWRLRDLFHLLRWRIVGNEAALQKLADKNIAWFRLKEDVSEQCLTASGKRAPPTSSWKLDFVIWMMAMNTFIQGVLCYFMWGYNRLARPGWSTGTFIGLGCGVAMLAGLMSYLEGRKVKIIEGPTLELELKKSEV